MPLHPGQIKYIEDTSKKPIGHINAGREPKVCTLVPSNRWGKSSLLACLQIHANFYKLGIPPGNKEAWFKALYRTANIAPATSLVEPVFQYIDQILTSSFAIRLPDGRVISNKCQIEWFYLKNLTRSSPPLKQFFANNSYIEHRTIGMTGADSLEGKPYGMITYDEGGRSNHLEQEVNGTLLARLFDWSGQLHLASTPSQDSTSILFHYELYQKGLNNIKGYYTMEGQLRDNIFFPNDQIQEQYDLYEGNPLRDQVIFGKFVFGGDNIFNFEDIKDAKRAELNDSMRVIDNHKYAIGIDTAMGSDEMVYTVLDYTEKPFKLVKIVAAKGNSKSPQRHLNDLLDLYDAYHTDKTEVHLMLETWNGESANFYLSLPDHVQALTTCYGSWQPSKMRTDNRNAPASKNASVKKADILLSLSKLLSAKEIHIPESPELSQQLSIYKEKDDNLPTDRVISLALACWLALEQNVKQDTIQFISW